MLPTTSSTLVAGSRSAAAAASRVLARGSTRVSSSARSAPAPVPRTACTRSLSTSTTASSSKHGSSSAWSRATLAAAGTAGAAGVLAYTQLNEGQSNAIQCEANTTDEWFASKPSRPDISRLNPAVIHDTTQPMRVRMETYVKLLQHRIVEALAQEEEGQRFLVDQWQRKEGGEGISCVLQGGTTFDKAGVNISVVHGTLPPAAVKQMSADHGNLVEKTGYTLDGPDAQVKGLPFYAAGLSLVVHPSNPLAPTVHFNYRYFELTHPPTLKDGSPNPRYEAAPKTADGKTEPVAWWFGGGTDLTPTYVFEEDAKHFHSVLKKAADANDEAFYPAWKKWCDTYFWIPHRGEARGIGGLFFDDLTLPKEASSSSGSSGLSGKSKGYYLPLFDGDKKAARPLSTSRAHDQESLFKTVRDLGDAFLPAYLPILQRRKNSLFTEAQTAWQQLRRGRYVEFNLVYDRGTKFGLQTPGARIESILMSLPLKARWEYMEPVSGASNAEGLGRHAKSEKELEEKTMDVLRKPRDWV